MADSVPCPRLTQQTLRWQLAEQLTAAERARVAVLELLDRRHRNDANIAATRKALADLDASLPALQTPLERAKCRSTRAALEATVARQELENLEGLERALRHDEALAAALRAADDMQRRLTVLDAAHGMLTDDLYDRLRQQLDSPSPPDEDDDNGE